MDDGPVSSNLINEFNNYIVFTIANRYFRDRFAVVEVDIN